jgi:hypothetical protein
MEQFVLIIILGLYIAVKHIRELKEILNNKEEEYKEKVKASYTDLTRFISTKAIAIIVVVFQFISTTLMEIIFYLLSYNFIIASGGLIFLAVTGVLIFSCILSLIQCYELAKDFHGRIDGFRTNRYLLVINSVANLLYILYVFVSVLILK